MREVASERGATAANACALALKYLDGQCPYQGQADKQAHAACLGRKRIDAQLRHCLGIAFFCITPYNSWSWIYWHRIGLYVLLPRVQASRHWDKSLAGVEAHPTSPKCLAGCGRHSHNPNPLIMCRKPQRSIELTGDGIIGDI